MARPREFFRSSNGDVWFLGSEGGRPFVLHRANLSAGGSLEKLEFSDFLKPSNIGPEHQELRRSHRYFARLIFDCTALRRQAPPSRAVRLHAGLPLALYCADKIGCQVRLSQEFDLIG